MNLESIDVEAQSPPKAEFVHIRVEIELERAVIFSALVDATRIREELGEVDAAEANAGLGKPAPHAARIDGHDGIFWYAVVRNLAIGAGDRRQPEHGECRGDEKGARDLPSDGAVRRENEIPHDMHASLRS